MDDEKLLRPDCYTQKFTDRCKKSKENKTGRTIVNKKPIPINLNFKVDDVATTISKKLYTVLAEIYLAAELCILYKTTGSTIQSRVDSIPFMLSPTAFINLGVPVKADMLAEQEVGHILDFSNMFEKALEQVKERF